MLLDLPSGIVCRQCKSVMTRTMGRPPLNHIGSTISRVFYASLRQFDAQALYRQKWGTQVTGKV